jgi:hypothetical protein
MYLTIRDFATEAWRHMGPQDMINGAKRRPEVSSGAKDEAKVNKVSK